MRSNYPFTLLSAYKCNVTGRGMNFTFELRETYWTIKQLIFFFCFAFLFQTIGKPFCYFNGFINTFFAMANVLIICSLCVYQYISVVLPMNKSLTNFRCLVMVLCAWAISVFLAVGPIMQWGRYEFTSNIFNCEYYHTTREAEFSYNITLMFSGYLFPCGFMVFSYVSILRALQQHHSRMAVTSSISPAPVEGAPVTLETKLYMTISVVFLTFLICRTPFFIFLLLVTSNLGYSPDFLGQLSFWAIYLHSACDPFIYAFKHTEYQDTLKEILKTFRLALLSSFCFCFFKNET